MILQKIVLHIILKLVKRGKVYDLEKYQSSADKYNLYLSGPTSIITIDNPNTKTKKELILFRDSFGSSIAPLLIENYRKITLIDFRYINEKLIEQYIKFENQDILFLYSVPVLNSGILKQILDFI